MSIYTAFFELHYSTRKLHPDFSR